MADTPIPEEALKALRQKQAMLQFLAGVFNGAAWTTACVGAIATLCGIAAFVSLFVEWDLKYAAECATWMAFAAPSWIASMLCLVATRRFSSASRSDR